MPRPATRRRIVTCDCRDCAEDEEQQAQAGGIGGTSSSSSIGELDAAARQSPPPKALLLVLRGFVRPAPPGGDGVAGVGVDDDENDGAGPPGSSSSLDAVHTPHLDRCAREGQLGFLAASECSATPVAIAWWGAPTRGPHPHVDKVVQPSPGRRKHALSEALGLLSVFVLSAC